MTASTLLGSALAELQKSLTAELIAVTIEQPGYAGFGVTTKGIITRNLRRWRADRARFIARQNGRGNATP